uniref:hypothetical protein n=1 Tax=unclassified Rhodococcus (in: high G+C Gram-positive bacteria) TaxID=192944 RepID=UPI0015950457|nr:MULTISPECIES: hypothetical protein [unclassified Rhodococcus (in: high G+C Gram-positive bacteria)]
MARYTPNAWATGDVVTKTKVDRLEAGAAAAIAKTDADNAFRRQRSPSRTVPKRSL